MNSDYMATIRMLKTLDEKQLFELFHDIDDIHVVERIVNAAYQFVEHWSDKKCEEFNLPSIAQLNEIVSDELDWKHQDDAQRYLDIKSTQEGYKNG